MKLSIGENYVRTLYTRANEKVCDSCKRDVELPAMYCREKKKIWHKDCFFEIPHDNVHFVGGEHEDLNIDYIKIILEKEYDASN